MDNKKKLTKKQEIIKCANSSRTDNIFIVSKIKPGQQKIFRCLKCNEKFDLSESVEYGLAVEMFKKRDDMCVRCYYKKTGKLVY